MLENRIVFWLVVFVVLIAIEAFSWTLTSIWFAGGALAALVCSLLGASLGVQALAFMAVSLALLYFTRPLSVRYFNNKRAKTNVDSLIGRKVLVVEDINNLIQTGRVKVADIEWMAKSVDSETEIRQGAVVEIVRVEGAKLWVQPVQEQ